jgi:hypothetical protein
MTAQAMLVKELQDALDIGLATGRFHDNDH